MGFPPKTVWKTSKQQLLVISMHGCMVWCAWAHETTRNVVPCAGEHGSCAGADKIAPPVQILRFSTLFRVFFHLAMPWNFKWFFFTLYCLEISYKNHWSSIFISSILHLMFCFVDLHVFSLKRLNSTYEVEWFMIKTVLQCLNWKQNKNFLKPLKTHLIDF